MKRLDFGVVAAIDQVAKPSEAPASSGGPVRGVERWLVRRLLRALGNPPVCVVLWNGQEFSGSEEPPLARVVIRDRRTLWRLVADPELHFGDAFSAGRVEVEGDLYRFLETVYRAAWARERPKGRVRRAVTHLVARTRDNTLRGSRSNIHHHYDLGNEFYELWLDREMVYTCAYFPSPSATLEEAQRAKMDLVCRKLWLRPGETVVEAGCGWGSLALYMARNYGVRVKAYNISHEQIRYARNRASAEGLDGRVEFIEDDYRKITGLFDVFVSIGMLEHVGRDHYRELGAVVDRCLGLAGRGMIHTIGRDQPGPINVWIERRIFPGAYPPSLREITSVLEPWAFSVLDVENLRLHYAETLKHWLARFDNAATTVAEMFDEPFVRAWRLYLAGSAAGFASGSLQLFQVLFARHAVNDIPWTRQRMHAVAPSHAERGSEA